MNNQQPWYYSWPAIIVAFLFFWPIGIVLLVLKHQSGGGSKQSVFMGSTNKKVYIAIGVVLILLGISAFGEHNFMAIFMVAGGVVLILYAENIAKRGIRNKKYIDLIVNQKETSLDKISNMCNVQYDIVVKELNQLITLGVLKRATLDETLRTIRVEQNVSAPATQNIQSAFGSIGESVQQEVTSNQTIVVSCPGCGAKVSLTKGTSTTCEYCDTPISAR